MIFVSTSRFKRLQRKKKARTTEEDITRARQLCRIFVSRSYTTRRFLPPFIALFLSLSLPFIRQTVQLRFDGIVFEELFFQFHPVYFRGKQWSRCSRNQFSRSLKSPRFDSMIPGLIIDYSGIVFSSEIRSVRDNVRFRGTWFSFTPR